MIRIFFVSVFFYCYSLFGQQNIQEEILLNSEEEKEYFIATHKGDIVEIEVKKLKGKKISSLFFGKYLSDKKLETEQRLKYFRTAKPVKEGGVYHLFFNNTTNTPSSISVKINVKTNHTVPAELVYRTVYDTTYTNEVREVEEEVEKITTEILQKEKFYLNSRSNSFIKGGKDRVIFPVYLPVNTVRWFYVLTANREEKAVAQTARTFSLASELTNYIDSNQNSLALAVTNLNAPPGADICDVYLVDP